MPMKPKLLDFFENFVLKIKSGTDFKGMIPNGFIIFKGNKIKASISLKVDFKRFVMALPSIDIPIRKKDIGAPKIKHWAIFNIAIKEIKTNTDVMISNIVELMTSMLPVSKLMGSLFVNDFKTPSNCLMGKCFFKEVKIISSYFSSRLYFESLSLLKISFENT